MPKRVFFSSVRKKLKILIVHCGLKTCKILTKNLKILVSAFVLSSAPFSDPIPPPASNADTGKGERL